MLVADFLENYHVFSANGSLIKTIEGIGRIYSPAIYDETGFYVSITSPEGDLHPGYIKKYNRAYELEWSFPIFSPVIASPTFNAEKTLVFAVTRDGKVIAIDAETGGYYWIEELSDLGGGEQYQFVSNPLFTPSDSGENYIVLNSQDGILICIDTNISGLTLREDFDNLVIHQSSDRIVWHKDAENLENE